MYLVHLVLSELPVEEIITEGSNIKISFVVANWSCWVLHFQCQTVSSEEDWLTFKNLSTRNSHSWTVGTFYPVNIDLCNLFPSLWLIGGSTTFVVQLLWKVPCECILLHYIPFVLFPLSLFSFLLSHLVFHFILYVRLIHFKMGWSTVVIWWKHTYNLLREKWCKFTDNVEY